MAARDKRAIYRGAEDGWQQAIELTLTPVLFALLGVWLDSRLGTRPLWTIVLIVFASAAAVATAYVRFQARADRQDAGKPWTRRARAVAGGAAQGTGPGISQGVEDAP